MFGSKLNKSELLSLAIGDKVEYNFNVFKVINISDYNWEDGQSVEYEVAYNGKKYFLEVEDDKKLFITYTEEINIDAISTSVTDLISSSKKAPKSMEFNHETFYFDEDCAGVCTCRNTGEQEELISWDFYNDKETKILSIKQWD